MKITSSAFGNGETIPAKYTCSGEGMHPDLQFADVPPAAKSLALIVDDPDAPSWTFVHWVVWNISPSQTGIAEAEVPAGAVEGSGSSGKTMFVPPCPPAGKPHRYFFKLYALDAVLDLPAGSNKADLLAAMDGHTLAESEMAGLFSR